jgi:hypothetical protein
MNFWPFKKKQAEPTQTPEVPSIEADQDEDRGELTIHAITYDEDGERIKVDMDWDEKFVNYLKRHGFTGATEEIIVHKYVASLYRNVVDDINEQGKSYE